MDVTTDSAGNLYWLLLIPGDGDCLFGSIANQLYGVNPNDELFKDYSLQLRSAAVREIESHMDVYYEYLAATACELIERSMSAPEKVTIYMDKLKAPGYWGGEECISAIANIYNVAITVYQHSTKIEFRPHASEHAELSCCNIYYREIGGPDEGRKRGKERHQTRNQNHYDSIIRILPNDLSSSVGLDIDQPQQSMQTRSRLPQPSEMTQPSTTKFPILNNPKQQSTTDRKRFSSDPLLLASKIARQECTDSQETVHPPIRISANTGIRFASLNVNGCRTAGKRNSIDSFLLQSGVHLAVLQEVNLDSAEILTPHYRWYLGGAEKSRKRGLAILVRLGVNFTILKKGHSYSNIQYMNISYQVENLTKTVLIVNVHGPSSNNDRFFAALGKIVSDLNDKDRLLIAGDFNSRLSRSNLTAHEAKLIGKFAGHDVFNANGLQMRVFINLYSLAVRSTQSNASFTWTWSNGRVQSQIDHLLTYFHSGLYLRRMLCTIPSGISTDHKALLCNIVENRSTNKTSTRVIPIRPIPHSDPKLLQNETIRGEVSETIGTKHP